MWEIRRGLARVKSLLKMFGLQVTVEFKYIPTISFFKTIDWKDDECSKEWRKELS